MQKKLTLAVIALCCGSLALAQNTKTDEQKAVSIDEAAFTFTEEQLEEDDATSENVIILNSNSNVYASQAGGFLFSPVRFRYRAFQQKYNDVYINGVQMNDLESGNFRYSMVGGLNRLTNNGSYALPFEDNGYGMTAMAGTNLHNFRPSNMRSGHNLTLSGGNNNNYVARAMYAYGSGFNNKGWAFAAHATYRWSNRGYVEGTFYNALSYYFGVQKMWGNTHSLSLATWGNPTERAAAGTSTDEVYWLTNNRHYNPNWGYHNGHKRNARVVNDFAPSAIATWDWNINKKMKLSTSIFGKYAMYSRTRLTYQNSAENPRPDYYKKLPSNFYEVWNPGHVYNNANAFEDWKTAYDYWTANKANQQINWASLYSANQSAARQGMDALYYQLRQHDNHTTLAFSSTMNTRLDSKKTLDYGLQLAQNVGRHYNTLHDILGGGSMHNVNSYAMARYGAEDPRIQYDLNTAGPNNMGRLVYEGDKYAYDYALRVRKAQIWSNYSEYFGKLHYAISAKLNYNDMRRQGYMRNGLFAENSFGKGKTAKFLNGGMKFNADMPLGRGQIVNIGLGYEHRSPQATEAFVAPELNNDFVNNLHNERIFSSEIGYQLKTTWLNANFSAYYSHLNNVSEWRAFYADDAGAFTYASFTGMKKAYYGLEGGLQFKITQALKFNLIGTISEAKNINNSHVRYLNSTEANYHDDIVYNKNMRENGTPLTAASAGLDYYKGGWSLRLNLNWYDRIYLSYAPNTRYKNYLDARQQVFGDVYDNEGNINYDAISQAKGHGGFMLDGSIGRNFRLKYGNLYVQLMVTNILNNENIVTWGYEQTRADNSFNLLTLVPTSERVYKFSANPIKQYIWGTNGMLNVIYRF
ncbi:MAG: TonB-dependent receptor [Prevotella sp.]|jgi:hypothetical protein|nr:TonB-dependent receptor [Prevotella sp.]